MQNTVLGIDVLLVPGLDSAVEIEQLHIGKIGRARSDAHGGVLGVEDRRQVRLNLLHQLVTHQIVDDLQVVLG